MPIFILQQSRLGNVVSAMFGNLSMYFTFLRFFCVAYMAYTLDLGMIRMFLRRWIYDSSSLSRAELRLRKIDFPLSSFLYLRSCGAAEQSLIGQFEATRVCQPSSIKLRKCSRFQIQLNRPSSRMNVFPRWRPSCPPRHASPPSHIPP
jgi:hypothetical protein